MSSARTASCGQDCRCCIRPNIHADTETCGTPMHAPRRRDSIADSSGNELLPQIQRRCARHDSRPRALTPRLKNPRPGARHLPGSFCGCTAIPDRTARTTAGLSAAAYSSPVASSGCQCGVRRASKPDGEARAGPGGSSRATRSAFPQWSLLIGRWGARGYSACSAGRGDLPRTFLSVRDTRRAIPSVVWLEKHGVERS